jgi:hypothetical protein
MAQTYIEKHSKRDLRVGMNVTLCPWSNQQSPNYGIIGGTDLKPTQLLSNITHSDSLLHPTTMSYANLVRDVCIKLSLFYG